MIIIDSAPPPPPPLPPMQYTLPRRKSKAKPVAAVIIAAILIGALGTYFFVLAPRMTIVNSTHSDGPTAQTMEIWQYSFHVTVKNRGILSGNTTIVCEFSYDNRTDATKSFTGSKIISLGGGDQGEYDINVNLPGADAVASIYAFNKSWIVDLT